MTQARTPSGADREAPAPQPAAFVEDPYTQPVPGRPGRRRAAFAFVDGKLVPRDPDELAEPSR